MNTIEHDAEIAHLEKELAELEARIAQAEVRRAALDASCGRVAAEAAAWRHVTQLLWANVIWRLARGS